MIIINKYFFMQNHLLSVIWNLMKAMADKITIKSSNNSLSCNHTNGILNDSSNNIVKQSTLLSADHPLEECNKDADDDGGFDPFMNYDTLEELCHDNAKFFESDLSSKGQRLYGALIGFIDHIRSAKELVKQIRSFFHEYDFDVDTPGNGYRSFVKAADSCISHSLKLCDNLTQRRNSLLFRKGWYMKEIEASNHLLASLCTCLNYLLMLHDWSDCGDLFVNGIHSAEELFERGDPINQYCFYGRCLGFQFCDSMKGVLRFIAICMAGFSESYYSQAGRFAKTTSSVWTSGKYFWNPELRARRIVNISQNSSVDFCKAFWFLAESELMHTIPSVVGSQVKINKIISIPPEPLKLRNVFNDELVDIPVPATHLGPGPVTARLLCSERRKGMIGERRNSTLPPADGLIIHCHGGGFVAQSSKSHELYLRDWAVALDTPILSIDYSLAPQAPFPRALEEVFYAYCWALNNVNLLGSTGKKIILAGDSAGANLNAGTVLKCIELGIRKPDGLFMAYSPVLVSFVPSPARMLCLMDPLLPFGFMMRCLKAYACPSSETLEDNRNRVKNMNDIKNAGSNTKLYTFNKSFMNSNKSSKVSISSSDKSNWEHVDMEDVALKSPSDATSDTFASASYHSETVENTELITPEDASSCLSFEEDSQPITIHMPISSTTTMQTSNEEKTENVVQEKQSPTKMKMNHDDKNDDISATSSTLSNPPNDAQQNDGEKYVSNFIEKYVLETGTEASENTLNPTIPRTLSEENILIETSKDLMTVKHIQQRINKAAEDFVAVVSSTFSKLTTSSEITNCQTIINEQQKNLDALIARSPSDEFIFQVPKDPYLSPYWACDETLAQFPPTKILTVEMDPCLDDCVMFAKKLKKLNVPVGLNILQGLPHGFLNFSMLSKEAHEGSKMCIKRLSELLSYEPNEETH